MILKIWWGSTVRYKCPHCTCYMPKPATLGQDVTCKRCRSTYRRLQGDVYERLADVVSA